MTSSMGASIEIITWIIIYGCPININHDDIKFLQPWQKNILIIDIYALRSINHRCLCKQDYENNLIHENQLSQIPDLLVKWCSQTFLVNNISFSFFRSSNIYFGCQTNFGVVFLKTKKYSLFFLCVLEYTFDSNREYRIITRVFLSILAIQFWS